MKVSDFAERQILKAQAEGQFDNLKGAGQPLNLLGDGSADAIGFRIMADAGVVPREIQLRKAVDEQSRVLRGTTGEDARKREMIKLADLQLRLSIEQEARRRFYGS
ncbi:DUF1992 domain-containing protein [Paracoccus liaowanqingii]|uniref:DUF1992 domain-containing protein n=1 Tax=Paracoccus liaowanqingii TaxID=2560053 RepID=A0A4V1BIX7_9RHOB|nr:DUF1992 domain-containing protein [Paracoccus liaowanqingii]QBX34332.1 DUF1992 domain-containing protein [Paracoccus liaowanqingii]